MASAKEYEILFRLNAQQNSGFSSTFSKAQAEFAKLGNEIKNLQKIQSDVSSYEKQQKAIEATERKLENLTKQQDLLRKQIDDTKAAGESSAALEREELKLEQQIANTTAALERQRDKLDTTGERLRSAGVDTENLAHKDEELTAQIKELQARQEEAAEGAQNFGQRSSEAFSAAASAIAAAGIAVALREIYDGYMECIEVASGFEESMSNVKALSGATADELEDLGGLAKELGATTKFTAKESADAMGYMAMAGWNAEQMLSGMPGVLQLAAASGEDLATVSDIVTDSLTAFGLTAADTSRYADILAQTATKANTTVSLMGETFKYAAPLAGALKYDVEDVAVATGLMANAGIKGSEAGTTLRNIFTRLAKPTKESADAMDALGLSMSDGTGKMYTWMELMEQMRDSFAGLTEEQKTFYAAELAGQRGMSGLLSIVNASEEDFNKLSAAISNSSGAAQKMADIKLDNLNGQITLFNSALEATKTTVGEELNPTMAELYGIGTEVLGRANDFLKAHPGLVKASAVLVGGLGALTAGILGVNAAIKIFGALQLGTMMATPLGPILAVTAGVVALTAAIVGMNEKMNAGIPSVKELTEAARDMDDTLRSANDAMEDSAAQMLVTSRMADAYIDALEAMPDAIDENNEQHAEYMRTLQLLVQTVPELASQIDLETGAIEGGTAALRENMAAWEENARAQAYQSYLTSLREAYNDVLVEQVANELKLTQAQTKERVATEQQARVFDELLTRLGLTEEQFRSYYGTVGDIPWRQYGEDVKALKEEYAQYSDEIRIAQETQRNLNKAMDESADAVAEAEAAIEGAQAAYDELVGVTEDTRTETEKLAEAQSERLASAVSEVSNRVSLLVESYNEAYEAAQKSVEGQYALWDEAEKVVAVSAGSINNALQSQISYWDNYNTNLEALRERTSDIEGLSDVIASFADGSKESVNAIAGMAAASDEDLASMVANYKSLQEAQEATEQSIADLRTNFSNEMDLLQDDLAEDIANMDMSAEAAAAGQATIEAFIKAANDQLPQVQAAYDRLGIAAARGLAQATNSSIDISTNTRGRLRVMGHYASGTDNAPPGWALVGEEGPELVHFGGGEQVYTAQETAAMQGAMEVTALSPALLRFIDAQRRDAQGHADIANSGAANVAPMVSADAGISGAAAAQPSGRDTPPVQVTVHIHVDGNASPDTLAAAQELGEQIRESVRDAVEEALEEKQIQLERSWY